ncbi:hypothetical protein C0J52_04507 [Blattella germanica]|nr:hypothetical protein C0J52_04507 [Blattella germanica]
MANRGYIKCYNNRPVNVLLSTSNETRRFLLQEEGQTHILFSEVYRVSKTRSLRSNYFGTWTPNERIVETGVQFYERRNNLQGIEPPVTILKRKEDNTYVVEGFFGKIWRSLEKTMNFTTEYSKPADDAWGSLTKNGTWNGMIGMILRNEVEIAVAEFTMTALRAGVVDFTIPLIDTRNCVLIRNPNAEEDISWLGFLEPFTSNLWIFVLTTIIVISLLLKLLYNLKLWYIGQVPPETIDTYSIIYIIGAFCSQGLNIDSGHSSLRILYFSAHLTALVLSAAYSAQLISFLSIQTFSLPFNSLRELIDIGTYKLGVLANSGQLNNFNTANDSLMKEVYTKLIEPDIENLPVSIEEGMQYICKYNKYAFMTSLDVVLGLLDHISCELMSVLGASIPESLAMSIKKRSPYRGLINFNLQAMRRNGVLKRLRQEEWPTKLPLATSEWSSIDIYKTIPILFIIITGVIVGMFLLTLEWCRHI